MGRSAVIYCDADLERGMGHLMRSLCLAEEARRQGWEVVVTGRFGGRALEHAMELAPAQELVELGAGAPTARLEDLLKSRAADLLHLDSYDTVFDSFIPGPVLVSNMQDGSFGRRPAGLHIDANLDAELRYRQISGNEAAILGSAGMQIRRAVRGLRHELRAELGAPFRVLVLLGGTDPFELTPRLVAELSTHPELHLTVICRPETQPALIAALGDRSTNVEIRSFTPDLPTLANAMDLVVTAAGTSVWDFAAAGIPMAIIAVAENQLPGYRACEAHGLGLALGEPPHTDLRERVSALVATLHDRELLHELAVRGPREIDGLGAWRVVSAWEELTNSTAGSRRSARADGDLELSARAATAHDARRLFEWRNDESTRAASRSSEPIAWESHVSWLHRVLADEDRKLLMIEQGEDALATVRWDRCGEHSWEASITLAPVRRGRGLGPAVLAAGESVFAAQRPVQLFAGIHVSNAASRRLFTAAGYLPHLPPDADGFETRAKWLLPTPDNDR